MHNFSNPAPKTPKEIKREFLDRYGKFGQKALKALGKGKAKRRYERALGRLIGEQEAYPVLTASNGRSRWALVRSVYKQCRRLWRAEPSYEFAHVTIILDDWTTSDETTVLELRRLRRRARHMLSQISEHYIAYVELQAFANVKAPSGGKLLSAHVHAVVFGENTLANGATVTKRLNKKLGPQICGVSPLDCKPVIDTDADLLRVTRYGLKAMIGAKRCTSVTRPTYTNPKRVTDTFASCGCFRFSR